MHAAINNQQLLRAEIAQRKEAGYDVEVVEDRIIAGGGIERISQDDALVLIAQLEAANPVDGWNYEEPESLTDIVAASDWPRDRNPELPEDYAQAVARAWNGRIVGNMLGKPVESLGEWSPAVIRSFLESHDAWPLRNYFPATTDTGPGFPEYVPCWEETTLGRIDGSSRDDDVDYTILNLHVLRTQGPDFTTAGMGAAWLTLLPFLQTYTAERVALRNMIQGIDPRQAGRVLNPYREYIGAAIRADVFGYIHPGDPAAAAELAYRDAVLTHTANGVYGEMWCAALVSAAFGASEIREAFDQSLQVVPKRSRLYAALENVRTWKDAGWTWDDARARIDQELGFYSTVHTVINAAVLAAGLLWGESDFDTSIALTVAGGLDTDSNGATAGSVAGIIAGTIAPRWTDPLNNTVHSAVFGYDGVAVSTLIEQTIEVALAIHSGSRQPVAPQEYMPQNIW